MVGKVLSACNLMITFKWLFGSDKSEPKSNSTCKGQHGKFTVKPLNVVGDSIYEVSGFTKAVFRTDMDSDWSDSLLVRYKGGNNYELKDRTMSLIDGKAYWFQFKGTWSERTSTMITVMPGDELSNNNAHLYSDESIEVREAIKCGFEAVHFFREAQVTSN